MEDRLEEYILSHIDIEDELLARLSRDTQVKIFHGRQVSGHWQGRILEMVSKMIRPKNILEIGTFTGYSAICLAKGLQPKGKLYTIEINDELEDFIRHYLDLSSEKEKIVLQIGDALEIIPKLDLQFDLVFIDANKKQYCEFYQLVFDKVKPGGFILADNILWDGKVVHDNLRDNDHFAHGILEFNEMVKNDTRVEKVILPIRDGMYVIRKKE
ncbi:MAG: O-methyltransferase [Bacteroidales bacterium]|nr:O-methyltransferase [Bacteroidales bacterium]MCF8456026.1 O-methyltransferase [Bacteroidales bacterium]